MNVIKYQFKSINKLFSNIKKNIQLNYDNMEIITKDPMETYVIFSHFRERGMNFSLNSELSRVYIDLKSV